MQRQRQVREALLRQKELHQAQMALQKALVASNLSYREKEARKDALRAKYPREDLPEVEEVRRRGAKRFYRAQMVLHTELKASDLWGDPTRKYALLAKYPDDMTDSFGLL